VAWDLHTTQINENHKIITLHIKDLYVNLSIQNILKITEFRLNENNQTTPLLKIFYTSWKKY